MVKGNVGKRDPTLTYHGIWVWGNDHADVEDNLVDYMTAYDAGTDVTVIGNEAHSIRLHSDTSDVFRRALKARHRTGRNGRSRAAPPPSQ